MDEKAKFIITSIREKLALGQTLQDAEFALRNVFGKEEVENAIKFIKEADPKLAGEVAPTSLSDNQDYLGWYRGPRSEEDSHWNLLKDVLRNKKSPWTEEMIKSLGLASHSVVEHLAPPKSQRPIKSKGLVLGYIQSGKTANFSAVIAKAVDEGYKLVVVLSGMHNNLRLQTQKRLVDELEKPKPEACTTLTRVDEKGDFDKRQALTANRALGSEGGFVLVVLKKNTHVLRSFNEWLSKAKKENLSNCATLIIDDESDQASIDTNKPEQNPTAINDKIREMIRHFDKVSYVGYTATPFANVLINGSNDDDLYPRDFLVTLEKPPTYFGPEELFGRLGVNGDEEKKAMPVLREIPELTDEEFSEEEQMPEALKDAIRSYIVSGTLRLFRGQRQDHIMMLIHTSHKIDDHGKYYAWVEQFVNDLQDELDDAEELPSEFKRLLDDDHGITTKYLTGNPIEVNEKKYLKELRSFVDKIELVLENSESDNRLSFDRIEPLWGIVVGGNTLSRGLTIEGLTTSYFDRTTKQYDTLLQMGRWFGYRKGYVDLTRIYLPEDMKTNFFYLATVEQEIRDEIDQMAANNEKPIDVAVRVRTFPNLRITAANKMRTAVKSSLTYSGSKIQFRTLNLNSQAKNKVAIEQLIAKAKDSGATLVEPYFEEWKSSFIYRNVNSELIIQFLEEFDLNTENIRFEKPLGIRYISDLNKHNELTDWSVCMMSSKSGKEHVLQTGESVFCVKRSLLETNEPNPEKLTLRSLVPPANELVDVVDVLKPATASLTEYKEIMNKEAITDTKVRRSLRPKERGLLLIYPIDSAFEGSGRSDLNGLDGPFYAISMVFPGSVNDLGFKNYVENESI